MTNDTPKLQMLPLFEQVESLQHWEAIRRIEIDNVMHYSILDIFQYYGSTQNFRQEWKSTLNKLNKQGFSYSTECIQYQFTGSDGKKKAATPIASFEVFLRISQSANFQHWESIRRFMSQAGAEKLESIKQRKQREAIEYMEAHGKGDVSGVVLLKAQYELNRGWDVLRTEIFAKCESPKMGIIVNKEYTAVFGMVADALKKELGTKSIRDKLPLRQVQALTLAEGMLYDILARRDSVTNEQIYEAIQLAIVPIGRYLRGISQAMGVSPVTGRPLLRSGKE